MEWVLMWTVIFLALSIVFQAVAIAYQHANGNLSNDGNGWLALSLVMSGIEICIIGGGYIYYLTYILPVVHGR